jgi:hypothetical protein
MPPPTGVVSGPLMETRRSRAAATESSGSQVLNWRKAFSPAKISNQLDGALAAVGLFDRGVEDALRGLPDVAAGAVAFNERE